MSCVSNLYSTDTYEQDTLKIGAISPKHLISYVGDRIEITCYSKTIPLWSKRNTKQKSVFKSKGNQLIIAKAKLSDSGIYVCAGSKGNTEFTTTSEVLVGSKEVAIWKYYCLIITIHLTLKSLLF